MASAGASALLLTLSSLLILLSSAYSEPLFSSSSAATPAHPPSHHHHHHAHAPAPSPYPHHHHHHTHAPTTSPTAAPTHAPSHSPLHAPPTHSPAPAPAKHHHHHAHAPSQAPTPHHSLPPHHAPVSPPAAAPSPANAHPPRHFPFERLLVAVQGVVYCKPCNYSGVDTLNGATPVLGATVKVTCNNSHVPQVFNATTDKNGYFRVKAPKTVTNYGVHKCHGVLGSTPDKACSVKSNLHGGSTGGYLRVDKKFVELNQTYVLFTVGPFAFEPPKCH
ncbi:unnamed protein product [Linum trigynum]|uniref:Uncharacterized protein n=1 Tax=Linum trigynum TaxID=586398 RepID=A0AAV2FI52_9ROSI